MDHAGVCIGVGVVSIFIPVGRVHGSSGKIEKAKTGSGHQSIHARRRRLTSLVTYASQPLSASESSPYACNAKKTQKPFEDASKVFISRASSTEREENKARKLSDKWKSFVYAPLQATPSADIKL